MRLWTWCRRSQARILRDAHLRLPRVSRECALHPEREWGLDGAVPDSRQAQQEGGGLSLSPEWNGAAIGYTLASGRLFCDVAEFHRFVEELLGRPIWTHEFADEALWIEMRARFEGAVADVLVSERK